MKENKALRYAITMVFIFVAITVICGIQWYLTGRGVNSPDFIAKANQSIAEAYQELIVYERWKRLTLCGLCISIGFSGMGYLFYRQQKAEKVVKIENQEM